MSHNLLVQQLEVSGYLINILFWSESDLSVLLFCKIFHLKKILDPDYQVIQIICSLCYSQIFIKICPELFDLTNKLKMRNYQP